MKRRFDNGVKIEKHSPVLRSILLKYRYSNQREPVILHFVLIFARANILCHRDLIVRDVGSTFEGFGDPGRGAKACGPILGNAARKITKEVGTDRHAVVRQIDPY